MATPATIARDDYASMLAAVEERLDERTVALSLGVDREALALVRVGRIPDDDAAERLRALYDLVESGTDLGDPGAVLGALGASATSLRPLVERMRPFVIAFFVADFLLVAGAALLFAMSR